ncbi:MAG TPA: SpoIIE family protein phosphatase, partial [Candidatus Limnocylindria bacterium]|nr:SpoIIE family protein phosphatase [Candidatus Limnocylindria bacterium]
GRILFANAAAQALARGEYPPGLAERVARGERIAGETIDWDARSLVVNGGTVVMPDGEGVGMLTVEDVTEIEGARRRSAVLAAASAALAESLDLEETLRTVQAIAVPRFADRCVVELAPSGEDPVQTADTVIVPLRARGTVIGALKLVMGASGRSFGEADLQAAQQLANRCALAIDNARLVGELRALSEEQRAILEGVADSVTAQAPDGRLVYANEAAFRLLGFESAAELLAAPLNELMGAYDVLTPEGEPFPIDRLPGRRALAGEIPEPEIVRFRARGAPVANRWSRIKARPVLDEEGRPRLAINLIEDITEIKEAEEAQRFLAEASRALAGSLDYEQTLKSAARLAVPQIADWCGIHLLGDDGEVHNVAVAHSDPEKVALAERLQREFPPDPETSGVHRVIREGRAELYPEITEETIAAGAQSEEHARVIRALGMTSAMVAPMRVRDRTIGTVTFVSAESGRRFTERDLAVAEDLALRAATAVDNARLYRTRSAIAQTLQASLLPPLLPDIPGVELGAAYRAAGEGYEVGGDFYDVFSTSNGQWFAVVGDVQGKGAEAAAVTALARYTIRAAAVRRRSPAAILRWVSEVMLRREEDDARFCTIACVHVDLTRTPIRITVACGGHPLPLLLRADGHIATVGTPGTLLGLVERVELEDRSTDLRPGETLVLYTDGLTEARAPDGVWNPEELAHAVGSLRGRDPQALADGLLAMAAPDPAHALRDDIAIVALRAAR